jgi:hypothetical protein
MSVAIPALTSATSVQAQTANDGVVESDPTTAYRGPSNFSNGLFTTTNVTLQTGQVVASTQAFERSGPGVMLDQIVMKELSIQLEDSIDSYVLTEVLSAITQSPVSDSSSYTSTTLWGDVAEAKQTIALAPGVRWRPNSLFMNSNQVDYMEQLMGTDGRPVFMPDMATASNADDGDTGFCVQSLRVYRDDNIPVLSGNNQLIVSRPDTVALARGDMVPSVFTQTFAGTLSVVLNLRQYVAVVPRYPNANEVITGSTYVDTEAAS